MQKEISSLYVMKAIAALWVVILHAPMGLATDYLRLIAGLSVPVFFAITGYFLYHEEHTRMLERLVGSIKKVIPIILILQTIYYAISPIEGSLSETYMLYFKWLVLGMPPAGGHLWYLTALLQAFIILWVWVKVFKGRGLWLFLLLWLARMAAEEYRMLLFGSQPSILSANVLFYALPCISMGLLMRKYESQLLRLRGIEMFALGSIALAYVNSFVLVQWFSPQMLGAWLRTAMIVSVFLLALKYKPLGQGSVLEYVGKSLSGNIYYFHGIFIMLLSTVVGYDDWGAIYVFVLSLAFAWVLVSLQRRLGISVLR